MRPALAAWLLTGCQVPLLDEPPYLVSLNGVGAGGGRHGRQANTHQNIPVSLPMPESEYVDLVVVADDPEGDAFEVWFPFNVGTVEFDPHGRRGRWWLPGPDPEGRMPPLGPLNLVLREPDDPSAATWYVISFDGGEDTASAEVGRHLGTRPSTFERGF